MELFKKTLILPFAFACSFGLYQLDAMQTKHDIFDISSPGNFLASIANKIEEDENQYFHVIVQLRSFFNDQKDCDVDYIFHYAIETFTDKRSIDLAQTILLAVDQNPSQLNLKTEAHRLLENTFQLSCICQSFEEKLLDKDGKYDDAVLMMLRILKDYNIPITIKGVTFDLYHLIKKRVDYNNDFDRKTALREILEFLKSNFIGVAGTEDQSSKGINIIYLDKDPFNNWLQRNHLRKSC